MPYNNPPVVVNAVIVRDGKVLIGRRGNPDGRGKRELIGGFLEANETLEEALAREVREEIGVGVVDAKYFGSWVGTYSDGRKLLAMAFVCTVDGEPHVSAEQLAFEWVEAVPDDMFTDCDVKTLAAYFDKKD